MLPLPVFPLGLSGWCDTLLGSGVGSLVVIMLCLYILQHLWLCCYKLRNMLRWPTPGRAVSTQIYLCFM
jgi:hypothetical protein